MGFFDAVTLRIENEHLKRVNKEQKEKLDTIFGKWKDSVESFVKAVDSLEKVTKERDELASQCKKLAALVNEFVPQVTQAIKRLGESNEIPPLPGDIKDFIN